MHILLFRLKDVRRTCLLRTVWSVPPHSLLFSRYKFDPLLHYSLPIHFQARSSTTWRSSWPSCDRWWRSGTQGPTRSSWRPSNLSTGRGRATSPWVKQGTCWHPWVRKEVRVDVIGNIIYVENLKKGLFKMRSTRTERNNYKVCYRILEQSKKIENPGYPLRNTI